MTIKKVSVLTLSLILTFMDVVVAAPRGRDARRAARTSVASNKANTTTVDVSTSVVEDTTNTATVTEVVATVENTVVPEPQKNAAAKINAMNDLLTKTEAVQRYCSGIKKDLDTVFGLTVATTVSSGLGTAAAGSALAVGIAKTVVDKKKEDLEKMSTRELYEYANKLTEAEKQKLKDSDISKLDKKSKTLGNVRTGLMAGATVTSAVSTGTSIGASVTAGKLAEKMEACNKAISDLKIAISTAEAEEVAENNLSNARKIVGACTGYSKDNINTLKKQMTASAIVSGIGTATAGAGTVTSALANSKKVRDDNSEPGKKKEKGLNLASNILAGITTGTSGASTILSATAIEKAKKDSKMAEECESTL